MLYFQRTKWGWHFAKNWRFLSRLAGLLFASGTMAQMRPGAKVEKTYGLGPLRDMDKSDPAGHSIIPSIR